MNKKILKEFLEKNKSIFGFKRIKIKNFKLLGSGESNKNYLLQINSKNYILRISLYKKNNLKKEFEFLKRYNKLKIIPKPILYHMKNKQINFDFLILEYVEGKTLNKKIEKIDLKFLAKALATLHNITMENNKESSKSENYVLLEIKKYIKKLNVYTKQKYKYKLNKIYDNLYKSLKNQKLYNLKSLVHGDVCSQNIIKHNNKMMFIDFESIHFGFPDEDIASLFLNFKLTKKQKNLFLYTYLKYRNYNNLTNIFLFMQLLLFNYIIWSLVRVFEIINKKPFSNKDYVIYMKYAKKELKRLNNFNSIF